MDIKRINEEYNLELYFNNFTYHENTDGLNFSHTDLFRIIFIHSSCLFSRERKRIAGAVDLREDFDKFLQQQISTKTRFFQDYAQMLGKLEGLFEDSTLQWVQRETMLSTEAEALDRVRRSAEKELHQLQVELQKQEANYAARAAQNSKLSQVCNIYLVSLFNKDNIQFTGLITVNFVFRFLKLQVFVGGREGAGEVCQETTEYSSVQREANKSSGRLCADDAARPRSHVWRNCRESPSVERGRRRQIRRIDGQGP